MGNTVGASRRRNAFLAAFFERYGWLAFFLACLALSYLVVWQHGLYTDDYFFNSNVVNTVTGERRLYIPQRLDRPLHFLVDINLAGLVPTYELFVRVLAAFFIAGNALLLGALAGRLTHSRLMAIVAAWLFLSPFMAHEGVLWISAYMYTFSVFFALLYLHACMTAFTHAQSWRRWALLAIACYAIAVGFGEQVAMSAALAPLLGVALAAQGRAAGKRSVAVRATALFVVPAAIAAAVVWFGYRTSTLVTPRGGLDVSLDALLGKAAQFLTHFTVLTVRPNTGLRLTVEAGKLGVHKLIDSPAALLVFLAAALLLLLTVVSWRSTEKMGHVSGRGALLLAAVGVVWMIATMLFPGIVVPNQVLVVRMLYVPLTGACIAGAVLAWVCARHVVPEKLVLLAAGGVLLINSICMLGYNRAYQGRYALDQRQLTTLRQALPGEYLPQGAYVIALELDERIFGHSDGMSNVLVGALQLRWTAPRALNMTYGRSDLQSVAKTGELTKKVEYNTDGQSLRVSDVATPLDKTVLFVYKDGKSSIIESLVIRQGNGATVTVRFPIAEKMAGAGLATLKNYPAPIVQGAQ